MQLPVIDICPLREPFAGKPKTKGVAFLRVLGLKMEAPEPSKTNQVSVQALAGILAQLPGTCELNLHLRDGRVVTLQWAPGEADKPV